MSEHILKTLDSDFMELCITILEKCKKKGVIYVPYFGHRTLEKQAKLWRQSRGSVEIKQTREMLIKNNAPNVANILVQVGAQYGKWATNALPAQSWHNHCLALDCYRLIDNKVSWDIKDYEILANVTVSQGLESGYFWESRDAVHIQLNKHSVLETYSWEDLNNLILRNIL